MEKNEFEEAYIYSGLHASYDPEAQAWYVAIDGQKDVACTEEKLASVIYDYDGEDNIIGIEILEGIPTLEQGGR